jgi:hypothetical protein
MIILKKRSLLSKITWITLGILIVPSLLFVASGIISGGLFYPRFNEEKIEKMFVKDYELLTEMVQFLVDSGHERVFLADYMKRGEMSINGGYRIEIEDTDAIDLIRVLKQRGYSQIIKNDNTIYFLRWSMRNHGQGITFLLDDGEAKIQYLTTLVPLSQPNWFCYEASYNAWRTRNPS